MENILKVLRTERHDFLNHLQVISGLVQLNKQDRVLEYIDKVTKEIYSLGKITRLDEPAIASVLLLKNYEAKHEGIEFSILVETELDGVNINRSLFSKGLDRILDIFFVQCKANTQSDSEVKVTIKEEEKFYSIEVGCNNVNMENNLKDQIYEIMEKLKEDKGVNAKYFDTDKKVRVYLHLDKQ